MTLRQGLRARLVLAFLLSTTAQGEGAELRPPTLAAYEQYVGALERQFLQQIDTERFFWRDETAARPPERLGDAVLVHAGHGDGIISVPDGLIHHWRGTAFVPGVTLDRVLEVARDFASYDRIYDWVVGARLFSHSRAGRDESYRLLLRIQRRAGRVTGVVDLWTVVTYRHLREGRVAAMSDADCIRQVENAGKADEQLLPPGAGSGYLWRANTFSKYLERDGGVYVELDNVALSRDFPPLLGWLIEPYARRLGRGSVARSLEQLRDAVIGRKPAVASEVPATGRLPAFWCTG
jgi:hypothetical protein